MPLPTNTQVALQGYSRPGEPVQTQPKTAMVVKLSEPMLEALQAAVLAGTDNNLRVRLGDDPGIAVGDVFYPMRPIPEGSPHDIYLRTVHQNKQNAPLKQYARVTGKFIVDSTGGSALEEKLGREKQELEERRKKGRIEMLDTIPAPASTAAGAKKKKLATRKPADHARNASLSTPNSGVPSRVTSPLPPRASPEPTGLNSLRSRMVHCIATQPQSTEDILKRVGGPRPDPDTRSRVMALLPEIAEQPKKSAPWQLKARSWREIRPYEWRLAEGQRGAMARQMRAALQELKTPSSDPVWQHLEPPSAALPPSMSASSSTGRMAQPLPAKPPPEVVHASAPTGTVKANGTSSAKERAKKPADTVRAKAREPIQAKDESMHATRMSEPRLREAAAVKNEGERAHAESAGRGTAGSAGSAPARRLPGSGHKRTPPSEGSPVLPALPLPKSAPSGTAPPRRTGPTDARGPRKESPAPSGRVRAAPPIPPPARAEAREARPAGSSTKARAPEQAPAQRTKSDAPPRAKDYAQASDRERETDREARPLRIAKKEKPKVEEGEIEQEERRPAKAANGMKRKAIKREEDESERERESDASRVKKRRLADDPPARPARPDSRDVRPPSSRPPVKRESPPYERPRVKKETPPVERAKVKKEVSPAVSVQSGKSKGPSTKARRDLAAYTSSEDEGEIREPGPRARQAKPRIKPEPVDASPPPPPPSARARPPPLPPLPDGANTGALNARYKKQYAKYLGAYQRVFIEKTEIERRLDVGSDTDTEGDVEMMNTEQLESAVAEYRALEGELLELTRIFAASVGAKEEGFSD